MDNRGTSQDVTFDYSGDGRSIPKDITSVRFTEGLQRIGHNTLKDCTSLQNVTLPSTLFEIDSYAFHRCRNLKKVILNDGLQKIGEGAFQNCTSLESITLPSTLVEIGYYAFCGCSNLKEVVFNDGLRMIGCKAFFNSSLESITLPPTVTLQSIALPSTLVKIGWCAFNGCRKLREVTLNEGLQEIEDSAFYNCASLQNVTLPSTLVKIGYYAFHDCCNLREVELNDGLHKINAGAFNNCASLESITLPSTLVEIGDYAFNCCSNLREVELNGVPQYVKSEAFLNCEALERVLFSVLSYRLVNIIQTNHWEGLEDKVNEVRGVVQWESNKLFVSGAHRNWNIIRSDFGGITRLVSYYELKNATSTFELALWKSKLNQVDASDTTNRAAYRIDVPGPVKDTMLQYLDCNW